MAKSIAQPQGCSLILEQRQLKDCMNHGSSATDTDLARTAGSWKCNIAFQSIIHTKSQDSLVLWLVAS